MALIARIGAAIPTANEATQEVLRDALAVIVEDHAVIQLHERRKAKDRSRKSSTDSAESTESKESAESVDGSPFPQVSLLPPTPPNNTSFPLSPPRLSTESADESGLYAVAPAILTGRYGAVIRGAMTDEEWQLVERFLATRPPSQQGDWLREIAKLLGPASGCTSADVDCALSDALLLDTPLRSAHALRVFVRTSRDERRRAIPNATAAPAPDAADKAWTALMDLLPSWLAREVTAETHAQFSPGMKRGLSAIGGFSVLHNTPADKRVWLKKEFAAAFHASPAKATA